MEALCSCPPEPPTSLCPPARLCLHLYSRRPAGIRQAQSHRARGFRGSASHDNCPRGLMGAGVKSPAPLAGVRTNRGTVSTPELLGNWERLGLHVRSHLPEPFLNKSLACRPRDLLGSLPDLRGRKRLDHWPTSMQGAQWVSVVLVQAQSSLLVLLHVA